NFKRGQRLLRAGDPGGAAASLERSSPESDPERALWLAWARALAGPPGTAFEWTAPEDFAPAFPEDADLMRATARFRAKDAAGARASLRAALHARQRNWTNLTFGPAPAPSGEMLPYAVELLAQRLTWLT